MPECHLYLPQATREVFPGSRVNNVPAGRRKTEDIYTTVYLSVASGSTETLRIVINPSLPDRDVASLTGHGTTVRIPRKDITAKYGKELPPVEENGSVVVGMSIGSEMWQIWGAYSLVESRSEEFVAKTYQRARTGASRLTRRALGHEEVVRIHGFDKYGVEAAVTFRRMGKRHMEDASYQIQEIAIHVPDRGGRHAGTWMSATDMGRGMETAPDYPVVEAAGDAAEAVVETAEAVPEGLVNTMKGAFKEVLDMESEIATSVTLSHTDAENRVHVAALINAVAAKQAELKALFQAEELTAEPEDVKRIQQELTEVSRIRSVLETHLNTLAAEASGEKELENISSDVHAAIGQSHALIGISASDRFSRWSETRKIRQRAKRMSRENATAAFLQAVADADAAQANGQVGTQFINRANIYYERLMQVSGHGQESVKAAAVRLQYLKATERNRYKGKQHRKKQQKDEVDMEEEERLASGK